MFFKRHWGYVAAFLLKRIFWTLSLVSFHHTTNVVKHWISKQEKPKDALLQCWIFFDACLIYGNKISQCTALLSLFRFWSRSAFSAGTQWQPGKPNHMPQSKWDYISLEKDSSALNTVQLSLPWDFPLPNYCRPLGQYRGWTFKGLLKLRFSCCVFVKCLICCVQGL